MQGVTTMWGWRVTMAVACLSMGGGTLTAQTGLPVEPTRGEPVTLAAGSASPSMGGMRPPEAWLQEDPGSRRYQTARTLLSEGRFREAADAFAELRATHPRSGYVPDSYYWEAFSLSRDGGRAELRRAMELLAEQGSTHPNAATRSDADALRIRIEGELARRGDARAAAAVAQQAQVPCGPEQETRLAALSALMTMNADQAVPILQDVLRQRGACSAELRARAVFLVAQKLNAESVEILLDLAHRNPDPDPEVRRQAVFWLHQVRSPEALTALEAILAESDDRTLQEQAVFAISRRTADARAMDVLRSFAARTDVPSDLRANAIFWVGQNTSAGGAEYLIELYPRLDTPELKENALFAIARNRSEASRAWLLARVRDRSETLEMRKNALFWAGQTGSVPTSDLRALFEDFDDTEMREQVVFVAAQRGSREDIDFLMEIARTADDPDLRQNAIFWLGQSEDPRVPEFLLSLIRG